jgi:hypothetical protein
VIRLNNEIKNQLCHNLLLASPLFGKAKDAVSERARIVEDIRQALLKQEGTSDEDIAKARDEFKDSLFISMDTARKQNILQVIINGEYQELSRNGLDNRFRHRGKHIGRHDLESEQFFGEIFAPTIESGFVPTCYVTLKKVGKLHDRLSESTVTVNSLYDEVDAFQLQVKGALSKCSTVKKLAEMWPEAIPYLPEIERREATSTALAIPVETLNALCGIPKQE